MKIIDRLKSWLNNSRVIGISGGLNIAQQKLSNISLNLNNDQSPLAFKLCNRDLEFPLYLRVTHADLTNYRQIFELQHYDFDVKREPKVIIDAGAYIGLASVLFAHKFPNAKIIAIEPAPDNLELLKKNTAPYPNVTVVPGALWHQNTMLQLHDPGDGSWSYMTQETQVSEEKAAESLPGLTISHILETYNLKQVDILKIDIEGAEKEVFQDAEAWIQKVEALMIELHEWKKPGCNRSFYNATNGFDHEWFQGENVYLIRQESCLIRK